MWYYSRDGQTEGPVSEEVLQVLVRQGLVGPNSYVYCDGWSDWKKASAVFPNLFGPAPPPLPPDARPVPSAPTASPPEPAPKSVKTTEPQESVAQSALGAHLQRHTKKRYLVFGILGLSTFFLPWNTEKETHFYWDLMGEISDGWSGMKGFLIVSLLSSIACLVVSRLSIRPAIRSLIVASMACMGALFFFVAISQSLSNTTRMVLMGGNNTAPAVQVASVDSTTAGYEKNWGKTAPKRAGAKHPQVAYETGTMGPTRGYPRSGPPPGLQRPTGLQGPSFAATVAFFVFFSFGLIALSFATRLLALQEPGRTTRFVVMGSVGLILLLWVLPVFPNLGAPEAPRTMIGLTFALFEYSDRFGEAGAVAILAGLYLLAILPLAAMACFGLQKQPNPTFMRLLSYVYTVHGPFLFVPLGLYVLVDVGSFGACFYLAFYLYILSELMVDGLLGITLLARKT